MGAAVVKVRLANLGHESHHVPVRGSLARANKAITKQLYRPHYAD